MATERIYSHERWAQLLDRSIEQIETLSALKGGEYAGDSDCLANFRRNGQDLELPMEVIWRVYAAKHWDAVGQYIRDLKEGRKRVVLEPISGRVDDLLVYLLLFKAMIEEREENDRVGATAPSTSSTDGGDSWVPHPTEYIATGRSVGRKRV